MMSEVKEKIIALQKYLDSRIIGQKELVRKLVITLLADGHALLEGAPGLAKTKAIKTLSECIRATYNRIQFTPDLLPSDITGSDIYIAERCEFEFRKGPIFANLVLADEINRAPAKVQSALLEAMGGRQGLSGRLASEANSIVFLICLWFWQLKILLNRKELTIFPKRNWIVF